MAINADYGHAKYQYVGNNSGKQNIPSKQKAMEPSEATSKTDFMTQWLGFSTQPIFQVVDRTQMVAQFGPTK